MKVAIATDTNNSIGQQEAKEIGAYLLPMPVIIDGKEYLEGIDITNAQLYQAMTEPGSSPPLSPRLGGCWNSGTAFWTAATTSSSIYPCRAA